MAIRNVLTDKEPILRKRCREVTDITDRIKETMNDMVDTMRAEGGVGLAAPQVGIMRRMFVAEPDPDAKTKKVYFMINPVIVEEEGTQFCSEGCLSVPGYVGMVERPERIKIKALDLDGNENEYEFEGFEAVVMCHENDHLNGILYTDKAKDVRAVSDELADELANESIEGGKSVNA